MAVTITNSSVMMTAAHAPARPPGTRYGRAAFGYLRRRISSAGKMKKYPTAVEEIVSDSMIEKKLARLPLVATKTITHMTEATTPELRFTAIGVPKLVNLPIQDGAAPSRAAMAWVRSAPSSQTAPLQTSVMMTSTEKVTSRACEWSVAETLVNASANPLTLDSEALGMTRTMPPMTSAYSTAATSPERRIIRGTSRCGLRISSAAPVDSSKPTHMNTRMPIETRKPLRVGLKSPAPEVPCGRPCWAMNAMNSPVNSRTTAILTNVPMFGPHLPIRNATMAIPVVTQMNTRPMTISQVVLSGLLNTKLFSEAIVAAVSVPPTHSGLDSQYRIAVTAPAARPNDIRAHSYGPPSTGKAAPSSATSMPYGMRKQTSEIASQVMACAPPSAACAMLSRPTIAQAVNRTRSSRPSTLRSLAFSWTASVPSADPVVPTAVICASGGRGVLEAH